MEHLVALKVQPQKSPRAWDRLFYSQRPVAAFRNSTRRESIRAFAEDSQRVPLQRQVHSPYVK